MTDVNLYLKRFNTDRVLGIEDEEKKKSNAHDEQEAEQEKTVEAGSVGVNDREGSLFMLEQAAMLASVQTPELANKVSSLSSLPPNTKEYIVSGMKFTVTTDTSDAGFMYKIENDNKIIFNASNCTINIVEDNSGLDVELQGNDVTLNSNVKVKSITNYAIKAVINGSNDDDVIVNRVGYATINGNDGHDDITNYGIGTTIHGNAGDDTITSKAANANVFGDTGKDNIFATGYNTKIDAGGDNNEVYAEGIKFGITATTGNNNVTVNGSDNVVTSGINTKNDIKTDGQDNVIANTNLDDKVVKNGEVIQAGNIGTDRPGGTDAYGRKLDATGGLLTGLCTQDGKMYNEGRLLTGVSTVDNRLYADGIIDTRRTVIDNHLYENGILRPGLSEEKGISYFNGSVANGYVGTDYYIDGIKSKESDRGLHIVDNKLYDGDKIAEGIREYKHRTYYNGDMADGVIEGDIYSNGKRLSTVEEQEYCASVFRTAGIEQEHLFGEITKDENNNITGFKTVSVDPVKLAEDEMIIVYNEYTLTYDSDNQLTNMHYNINDKAITDANKACDCKFRGADNYLGKVDTSIPIAPNKATSATAKNASGVELYSINITQDNKFTGYSNVSLGSITMNFENGKTITINSNMTVTNVSGKTDIQVAHRNNESVLDYARFYTNEGNFEYTIEYTYESGRLVSTKQINTDNSYFITSFDASGRATSMLAYDTRGEYQYKEEYSYHGSYTDVTTIYPDGRRIVRVNDSTGTKETSYSAEGKKTTYSEKNSEGNPVLTRVYDNEERVNELRVYTYDGESCTNTVQNNIKYNDDNKVESFNEAIFKDGTLQTSCTITEAYYDTSQNLVVFRKTDDKGKYRYYTTAIPTDAEPGTPIFGDSILADNITIAGQQFIKGIAVGKGVPGDYSGLYPDNEGLMYERGSLLTGISSVNQHLYEGGLLSTGTKEWGNSLFVDGIKDSNDARIYGTKLYLKGDLCPDAEKDYDNKLFLYGIKADDTNHEFNGKIYQYGDLDTADETEFNNHLYLKGVKATGDRLSSTNVLYENGDRSVGYKEYGPDAENMKLYKNGIIDVSGGFHKVEASNTLYHNGSLYTGKYENAWYTNGHLRDGDVTEGNSVKTYSRGVLIKSVTDDTFVRTKTVTYYYQGDESKYTNNAVYSSVNNHILSLSKNTYDNGSLLTSVTQNNFVYNGDTVQSFQESVFSGGITQNSSVYVMDNNVDGNILYSKNEGGGKIRYYKISNTIPMPTPATPNPEPLFTGSVLFEGDYNNKYYQEGKVYSGERSFPDGSVGLYVDGYMVKKTQTVDANKTKITFYTEGKETRDALFDASDKIIEIHQYSYDSGTKTTVLTQNNFVYNGNDLFKFDETTSSGTYTVCKECVYNDGSGQSKLLFAKSKGNEILYYTVTNNSLPTKTSDDINPIYSTASPANGTINGKVYSNGVLMTRPNEATRAFIENIAYAFGFSYDDIDLATIEIALYDIKFRCKNSTVVYRGESFKSYYRYSKIIEPQHNYEILKYSFYNEGKNIRLTEKLVFNDSENPAGYLEEYYNDAKHNLKYKRILNNYGLTTSSTSYNNDGVQTGEYNVDSTYLNYMNYLNSLSYPDLNKYVDMSLLVQTLESNPFTDFKLSNDIKSDIDNIIRVADNRVKADATGSLTFGGEISKLMVKDYKTTPKPDSEILSETVIGDVLEKADGLYVHDKNGLAKLNMTKETYLELFPALSRYTATQFGLGDCYYVSGVLLGCMENSSAYAEILKMFSENTITGDITITFGGLPAYPVTFPKGELFKTTKYSNPTTEPDSPYPATAGGSKGIQMLEQAYALAVFARDSYAPVISLNIDNALSWIEGGNSFTAQNNVLGSRPADYNYIANISKFADKAADIDKIGENLEAYVLSKNAYDEVYAADLSLYTLLESDSALWSAVELVTYAGFLNDETRNIWANCFDGSTPSITKLRAELGEFASEVTSSLTYLSSNPEKFAQVANMLKNKTNYHEYASAVSYFNYYDGTIYEEAKLIDNTGYLGLAIRYSYNESALVANTKSQGLYQALRMDFEQMLSDAVSQLSSGTGIVTLATLSSDIFPVDDNGNKKFLDAGHAYYVESIDSVRRTVTLINPWNGSLTVTISYDDLIKYFYRFDLADMTKVA